LHDEAAYFLLTHEVQSHTSLSRKEKTKMNGQRIALRIISAIACLFLTSLLIFGQTPPQKGAQPAAGAAAAKLTPYTAPDKSATVGVPPGWKVTKGANAVIQMSGPKGESISLGNGVFVRNGAFQAGQKESGLIAMSMPYQATLNQKYVMLWQQASATSGQPAPQVNIISATPIPIAKALAECAVYLGTMTKADGTVKFESRFCSLPMDSGGIFKLFWMTAFIPEALAPQERATAEAVFASYKLAPATLTTLFQPLTPVVRASDPRGGGGGMPIAPMADHTSECMDLSVIREVPEWRLPSYCH
jgi:hypothetical protein